MKIKLLASAILATALAAPVMADDSMLFQQSEMVQMLLKYDTNGDGVLSRDEIVAAKTAEFNAVAGDDASMAWTEFQTLQTSKQADRVATIFKVINTDTTNDITLAEFTTAFADKTTAQATTVFNLIAGSDASMSATELATLFNADTNRMVWLFAGLDTDGNGALSLSEYTTTPNLTAKPTTKPTSKTGRK